MDLATFRELLTPTGQAALEAAAALTPTEPAFLAAFETLRKRHPPTLAKAALETVLLRDRARTRFSRAEQFFFTREALEQASSESVSRHRAERYSRFGTVLDLCCGVGMDAIPLAAAGCRVEAIDSDPLRLAMAEANAAAIGVADRIRFHLGDVRTLPLPPAEAAFLDPARRSGSRRHLDPNQYEPPLDAIRARFPAGFPLGVKIAPGVARSDFEFLDAEVEFISSAGELKECVLWFGPLRSVRRRATVLPGHTLASDDPPPDPVAGEVGAVLYDPNAAVIRAGLVGLLAEHLDATALEPGIALLSGESRIQTPFADSYRIEACLSLRAEPIRAYCREHGIGRITILKRAVDVDSDALQKKLKLVGSGHRHVVLTRVAGKPAALIATISE